MIGGLASSDAVGFDFFGAQVRLGYVDHKGIETERSVHPLGIVAKGPTWYLVSNTEAGRRTFRIDRVSSVAPTEDSVHRPEDFDLAESWREIADEVDRKRTPLEIQAVCAPDGIGLLRMVLGPVSSYDPALLTLEAVSRPMINRLLGPTSRAGDSPTNCPSEVCLSVAGSPPVSSSRRSNPLARTARTEAPAPGSG